MWIVKKWQTEPARMIAFITACVGIAVAFGVHISDAQAESIKNALALLLPLVAGEVTRSQVSPTGAA